MRPAALVLAAVCFSCFANEREINRALIERDQRTAEFAAGVDGNVDRRALEILHQRQLFDARPLAPRDRDRMAREREGFVLRLPPPVRTRDFLEEPLPLPGGPRHGVEPVPANRVDG